ncbi:MAG: Rne/Rng family ribonuclease [Deltaproteobacteria bacterium]
MGKEILINSEPRETRVAIVRNGRLDEYYVERPQDKTIVGNIYKGTIDAVIPSIGGAFVDIGMPKKGFLYLSEIEYAFEGLDKMVQLKPKDIKKGQEVLVQVVKEPFSTKGPRLSCHIGIAGRYLVIMPQDEQIGISRRVDDEERKRLRSVLQELKLPKDAGFIVRTAASGKSAKELLRDANFLIKLWKRMDGIMRRKKAPALIYEEYDLVLRVIRDSFTEDVERLVVDSKPEFYRIQRFMRSFLSDMVNKVQLYRGDKPLFEEKDIEKQILRTFETKVYFKSKAYIIIEPTEGLVVVDVNSGGFKEKVNQEEAAYKINCEAAQEVAHQLRLRDLGGIIVIDFIDMERESHRRGVLNVLKQALSEDKAKYDILGISKFGLVEMTRERIHNTVQTLAYKPCPYCIGKGKVKSPLTMSIEAMKEVSKFVKSKGGHVPEVTVTVNPEVAEELMKDKESIRYAERKNGTRINLCANAALRIEDYSVS